MSRVRYLATLLGVSMLSLAVIMIVLYVGALTTSDSAARDLWLLAGGLIAGIVTHHVNSLLSREDAYKQGAYTERAKAVQELLELARSVKDDYRVGWVTFWQRERQTDLDLQRRAAAENQGAMRNLEADTLALRNRSFFHSVWIGKKGVDAVREFNRQIDESAFSDQDEVAKLDDFLNRTFETLRTDLLRGLGYVPD